MKDPAAVEGDLPTKMPLLTCQDELEKKNIHRKRVIEKWKNCNMTAFISSLFQ